jgi:hypothetical protein
VYGDVYGISCDLKNYEEIPFPKKLGRNVAPYHSILGQAAIIKMKQVDHIMSEKQSICVKLTVSAEMGDVWVAGTVKWSHQRATISPPQ